MARDALTLRQYGASPGSHTHDHFQVLLGVDGVLELEVQGRGRRVTAGEGCMIGPGERHDFESSSGAQCLLLDCWRPHMPVPGRAQRPIDWLALQSWARQHWHQPLIVADLAGQVFLSPTQFAARCRAETGTSPMQWLRQLRLAHAKALQTGGLGVAQTALRCGYQSASALTAALRANGH